jgi:hypothetical protein
MSRTIAIPDEVYAQLEQPAPKRGLTLPQPLLRWSMRMRKPA